jgi:glutathione peroxidase
MASLATMLAGFLSPVVRGLRGTTRVAPLSEPFYRLTARELDGTPVDLSRFSGRVSLVVNVASECGFTPQYAGLQELYERYRGRGFVVLGFPSNEFGGQEPGGPAEIRSFCEREYGVTFPMFEKVQTKPGPAQSPVWRRLGESGHLPAWNFYKFLIGREGQVVAVFPTSVPPDSRAVRQAIERALSADAR